MNLPAFDDATMTWSEPDLVQTTRGLWPAAGLERSVGGHENDHERVYWVEYRLQGEMVHRSAGVVLKEGAELSAETASFG